MISIIATKDLPLTSIESLFDKAGFECFPRGDKHYCFRRFFKVSELQQIWQFRFKRTGALAHHEVTLTFSEADNVISACIMAADTFIEFEADSPKGKNLMWGFGLDLSNEAVSLQQEAS
ncbi:MAG: hypothetical protein IT466_10280 [Moraxellaceae bacterium]|nr:hypothetical protein [Moraxellaceae bacterium]